MTTKDILLELQEDANLKVEEQRKEMSPEEMIGYEYASRHFSSLITEYINKIGE